MTSGLALRALDVPGQRARGLRAEELKSRRAAIGLLIFIIPMPLQWQSLGHGPLGTIRYFHLGALIMLLIARPGRDAIQAILSKTRPLPAAALVVTVYASVTQIAWHGSFISPVQVFIYLVIGLFGGAVLIQAMSAESGRRLLALSGPITVVIFLGMFTLSVQQAGVNAFRVFSQSILSANTKELEYSLYRAAFRATDPAARDNLRHEVVAALLVATYLSMAVSAYGRKFIALNVATAVLTFGIVSISLSRAVMVAMVIPMVLALIKVLARPRMPVWGFFSILVTIALSPLLFSKLGPLIGARFADTSSYNGRVSNLTSFTGQQVVERTFVGGRTLALSTHMWVVDSLLNGSIVCGIAAAVCVFVMFKLAFEAARLYFLVGGIYYYALMAAVTVTITRSFTTGGGNIYQGEWFAVGMCAAGLYLVRDHAAADGPPTAKNDAPAPRYPSSSHPFGQPRRGPVVTGPTASNGTAPTINEPVPVRTGVPGPVPRPDTAG